MTQDTALAVLKTGANVFLTGEPGSGKSHTVNRYVSWLRRHGIEPSITASTGIAATHIGGQTIHSFTGIGVKSFLTDYDLDEITQNRRVTERVRAARVLIIDEVSMLAGDTLAMADRVMREVRQDERPFGGVQVVLVGDFFQLPPVISRTERGNAFAFAAPAWKQANFLVCYLSEQHRQDDGLFLDLLSSIRQGVFLEEHRELLRTRYSREPRGTVTQLYSKNADVDAINDRELAALAGNQKAFVMASKGPARLVEALAKNCLSPETLVLKEEARVMFTKNDPARRYVNGTLGVVIGFDSDTGAPVVETRAGDRVAAEPVEWALMDGDKALARIVQVPLRLAWAMTIHKSQGMSLDAAHMDLADAFEYGQGYVALSRVRSLQGLSIAGLNVRALEVHPLVREKDRDFKAESRAAEASFLDMDPEELAALHERFIVASGGSVEEVEPAMRERSEKVSTYEQTRRLVKEGLPITQIVAARGMTLGTIVTHLEKLCAGKELDPEKDLDRLDFAPKSEIAKVHKALAGKGAKTATAIFRKLKGEISFEVIRLARLTYQG